MRELSFFETEALDACIQEALNQIGAPEDSAAMVTAGIDESQLLKLNAAIVELCQHGLTRSEVESTIQPWPPAGGVGANHLRVWSQKRSNGQPQTMLFIRVRDLLPNVGIQLLALALAISSHSPSAITNALTVMKTLYDHSVKLESPRDDNAMRAFQALLRHSVMLIAKGDRLSTSKVVEKPKASDLAMFGGPESEALISGLIRLREVKLADVVLWGDRVGDVNHPDNRWGHRV